MKYYGHLSCISKNIRTISTKLTVNCEYGKKVTRDIPLRHYHDCNHGNLTVILGRLMIIFRKVAWKI